MALNVRAYEFVTGVETSTLPDAGTPTDPNDLVTLSYLTGGGAISYKAGENTFSNGSATLSVTFATAFGSNNYTIAVTIRNTTTNASINSHLITAKTASGFTIKLNEVTDSGNYVAMWTCIAHNDP